MGKEMHEARNFGTPANYEERVRQPGEHKIPGQARANVLNAVRLIDRREHSQTGGTRNQSLDRNADSIQHSRGHRWSTEAIYAVQMDFAPCWWSVKVASVTQMA